MTLEAHFLPLNRSLMFFCNVFLYRSRRAAQHSRAITSAQLGTTARMAQVTPSPAQWGLSPSTQVWETSLNVNPAPKDAGVMRPPTLKATVLPSVPQGKRFGYDKF